MCCLAVTWYSDKPLIQVESLVNFSNFVNFDPPDLCEIICRNKHVLSMTFFPVIVY